MGFYGKYAIFPFFCAFMKVSAGFITEFTNILIIVQSHSIENCIKDFVAFGFICELDNLMMSTVTSIDCQEEIENAGIAYPKKFKLDSIMTSLNDIWFLSPQLPLMWKVINTLQMTI